MKFSMKLAGGMIVLMHFAASAGVACDGPAMLSRWLSLDGANGLPRAAPHPAVDFGESAGAPVLAALDGHVAWAEDTHDGCGLGIALKHAVKSRGGSIYTIYCHLDRIDVAPGQAVKRGAPIGAIGTSGKAMGVAHLHFELSASPLSHTDGALAGAEDPEPYFAGFFDPAETYPAGRFVLTYPVQCRSRSWHPRML